LQVQLMNFSRLTDRRTLSDTTVLHWSYCWQSVERFL